MSTKNDAEIYFVNQMQGRIRVILLEKHFRKPF